MAIVSPFAKIQDSLPPLTPEPRLTFDPSALGADQMPNLPDQPRPKVVGRPSQTTAFAPLEGAQQHMGERLSKDYAKDENPYGSPTNHPGVFGKILHGLSVATGGPNRRNLEEMGLQKSLQDLIGNESKNELEGAQAGEANARTGLTKEETAELPGKTQSEESLQGGQTREANARANVIENPPDSWKAIPGMLGPNGQPVEYNEKTGAMRLGGIEGVQQLKQPKPDSPEQQYIDEYMRLHQGSTVADAERAYTTDTQKPPQAIMLTPGEDGNYTAQNVRPGSKVAGNAITPGGENTLNTPTAQSRNMAEMAKTVLPQMTAVNNEIDQLSGSIGPAIGRWNQLLTNKGGTDFPQFAKLDTDLDLLASAIVRTHFGARGGQGYREELRKMFGEAQSPDDLKARIAGANGWLQGYAHMADRGGTTPEAQTFTDNGTTYNIPKDQVEAFKKDHPHAR